MKDAARVVGCGTAGERRALTAAMSSVEVEVPEGCGPGDLIAIETELGDVEVEIPDGLAPGDVFEVELEHEEVEEAVAAAAPVEPTPPARPDRSRRISVSMVPGAQDVADFLQVVDLEEEEEIPDTLRVVCPEVRAAARARSPRAVLLYVQLTYLCRCVACSDH